jgi:hypothetical protein
MAVVCAGIHLPSVLVDGQHYGLAEQEESLPFSRDEQQRNRSMAWLHSHERHQHCGHCSGLRYSLWQETTW